MVKTVNLPQIEQKLRLTKPFLGLKSCLKGKARMIISTPSYHRHLVESHHPVLDHPGYRILESTRQQLYSLIKANHMVNVLGF